MNFNEKYEQIKILYQGFISMLIEVKQKFNDKRHYALKLVKKILSPKDEKEIEQIKKIKSKYIIELKDNFYDKNNEAYCIVMELCDSNLRKLLKKYYPKGLPLNIINKIFIQLNDAFKAMIDINLTHRNLKPENILINYTDNDKINFDIKLSDFGLSTNEKYIKNYIAPELEKYNNDNKCDLWSLGVILYELYTNKYIFYSNNRKEREINKYEGKIVKETDNKMINKLIRKLIQVDINKRIKWEEYFNYIFFKIKEPEQIIKIKIIVKEDNENIKIFNGNEDINEKNIQLFIENKKKEFKKEINNLKKGVYNLIIKINQFISNCKEMFKDCYNIIEINFIKFDTKNVTDMSKMFLFCRALNNLNIKNFDTKNVSNMSDMFSYCKSLNNLDISNFDTKNVTDMSWMFNNCISLSYLDITHFVTKNVTDMSYMFCECISLNYLDITNFDTKNVTDMSKMFFYCESLNSLNITSFDTKNVRWMKEMFWRCSSLNNLDISNFDFRNVINKRDMFRGCKFNYDKKNKSKDI